MHSCRLPGAVSCTAVDCQAPYLGSVRGGDRLTRRKSVWPACVRRVRHELSKLQQEVDASRANNRDLEAEVAAKSIEKGESCGEARGQAGGCRMRASKRDPNPEPSPQTEEYRDAKSGCMRGVIVLVCV